MTESVTLPHCGTENIAAKTEGTRPIADADSENQRKIEEFYRKGQDLRETGNKCFKEGNYTEALKHYTKVFPWVNSLCSGLCLFSFLFLFIGVVRITNGGGAQVTRFAMLRTNTRQVRPTAKIFHQRVR